MVALSTVLALLASTALAGPSNEHVHVESSTDRRSSASAIAFIQGLYPPFPHVSCDSDVPSHNWMSDGTVLNYPLGGYQYPNIRTIAPDRDPDSIWAHGHGLCRKHEQSMLGFSNNSMANSLHQGSRLFYSRLWDKLFCEAFPRSQASFYNAHELYNYATYRWTHENSSRSAITPDDLETLRHLAWQEQSLKHGYSENAQNGSTSTIAGRTLASRVAALFAENIETRGERNKLNLAFTSHEPFLSFFALADLNAGPSRDLFSQLPEPGATLTFELFSVDESVDPYETESPTGSDAYGSDPSNNDDAYSQTGSYGETPGPYGAKTRRGLYSDPTTTSDQKSLGAYSMQSPPHQESLCAPRPTYNSNDNPPYPSADKLYVRFLYQNHNNGSAADKYTPCPLFGNTQTSIPFKQFNAIMSTIGIANATTWCHACESTDSVFFCQGAAMPHDEHHHHLLAVLLGSASTLLAVAVVLALVGLLT
ncbi:histidine phosphatase superfamily [Chaetomium tenue]|uniref:Histidine phosphatase superfamily n=1 Tax=Chaetomium tenue TaxID=1854479 RepID=A0ACB7NZ89_9PEZI|nr:histidine phosphatase superfamily [Chaetomium globosum]